jgi:hypothetical protein
MALWVLFAAVLAVTLIWAVPRELRRRKALALYMDRECLGTAWRRTFPASSSDDIRRYLGLFAKAFFFPAEAALKFAPTDRVIDVYRAAYPEPDMPDAMEVETFVREFQAQYAVKLPETLQPGVTLGELFALTQKAAA